MRVVDLAKELLAWAPGCPGLLARRELVRSAQRFCRATHAVTRPSGDFVLAAGIGEVSLLDYTPSGEVPLRAVDLRIEGLPAMQTTESAIATDWRRPTDFVSGRSPSFLMLGETALRVYPYSDISQTLSFRLATMPSDKATTLADDLAVEWREAILGGALQRICVVPGQPYTSSDHASMGASWFATGVNLAKIEVNRSHGAAVRVTMRPFA